MILITFPFSPLSQILPLLVSSNAPLPKLITACHILLGSLDSDAGSRRPPQVLKTDVTGLLKWVISTALLSSAAVARMGTKLCSPGHRQPQQGAKGLGDKVTEAHSWHCVSFQNYLLMRDSIFGRTVEPELRSQTQFWMMYLDYGNISTAFVSDQLLVCQILKAWIL